MPKEVGWQVQPSRFSFSHRWADQEASVCLYELIVQLLDAKQAKLHHLSPRPIHQGTTSIPFKVSLTGAKRKNKHILFKEYVKNILKQYLLDICFMLIFMLYL